jgi:hypothetical protein
MGNDQATLITYKGLDVLIRYHGKKYQIGIRGKKGIDMWVEAGTYDTLNLARTSGKEYACILIDKMLVSRKKAKI